MRKQFILLLFLSGICSTAAAQIGWQVKAAIGTSDFKGSPLMTTAFSYKAGIGADIPLSGDWALQPILYFTSKGSKADIYYGYEQIDKAEVTHRLYYLELPLFAAYKFDLAPDALLSLKAGPYISYGLKGKASLSDSNFDNKGYKFPGNLFKDGTDYHGMAQLDNKQIATPAYNHFDVGIGLGVELNIRHVLIGAEGSWGITSFGKDFTGEDLRQAAGYLTVGYQF